MGLVMKFIKESFESDWGSKKVHWIIDEDIKHVVEGAYIVKGAYQWDFYNGSRRVDVGYASKKSDMIAKIYEYSESIDIYNAEQEIEQAKKDHKNNVAKQFGEFKKMELSLGDGNRFFKVGEFVDAMMCQMSKNSNIVDYYESVYLYSPEVKVKARIEKVIELSNSEYDEYINNFFSGEVVDKLAIEFKGVGGNDSDSEMLKGIGFDGIMSNDRLKKEWFDSNFELVIAVVSDGKKAILVNPHGYDYARYVMFAI